MNIKITHSLRGPAAARGWSFFVPTITVCTDDYDRYGSLQFVPTITAIQTYPHPYIMRLTVLVVDSVLSGSIAIKCTTRRTPRKRPLWNICKCKCNTSLNLHTMCNTTYQTLSFNVTKAQVVSLINWIVAAARSSFFALICRTAYIPARITQLFALKRPYSYYRIKYNITVTIYLQNIRCFERTNVCKTPKLTAIKPASKQPLPEPTARLIQSTARTDITA